MQMWENKGTLRASPWSAGVLRLEKRVTPLPRVTVLCPTTSISLSQLGCGPLFPWNADLHWFGAMNLGELHRGPIGHGQIAAPYLAWSWTFCTKLSSNLFPMALT
jgi:hypothetical protein